MPFYLLHRAPTGPNEGARTDALRAAGTRLGDAPRCEACGEYIGMRSWLPPYRVELDTWGREFGDLAFQSVGANLLVSAKFKGLYEEHQLTGLIGFEPVEVVKVRRHRKFRGNPPPYFKATVHRSRTMIDQVASALEWDEPPTCQTCRLGGILKRWKGIVVQPQTWAGEDVFIARGMPGEDFIASARFKESCEANQIRNAVFIPAGEYSHDFYPWEKEPQ